jgi:hypothetical protein
MTDAANSDWGWWRERRPSAGILHLDTAAAGRSSRATLAATAAHSEREAVTGAYVAAAEAAPVLAEGQAALGRLLGVPAKGVAFVPSAEAALGTLLAIWPLAEGDTVAVVPCVTEPWWDRLKVSACARRTARTSRRPGPGCCPGTGSSPPRAASSAPPAT